MGIAMLFMVARPPKRSPFLKSLFIFPNAARKFSEPRVTEEELARAAARRRAALAWVGTAGPRTLPRALLRATSGYLAPEEVEDGAITPEAASEALAGCLDEAVVVVLGPPAARAALVDAGFETPVVDDP